MPIYLCTGSVNENSSFSSSSVAFIFFFFFFFKHSLFIHGVENVVQ